MSLKYLILFFIISMLTSSTCDKVSSPSKTNSYEVCDEITDAAQKYWVTNKDSLHAPNYIHYCDMKFIHAYKEAFKANKACSQNRTISGIKQVLGEPDKITPGVGGIFSILGKQYHTYLESNEKYETAFYECVTNIKTLTNRNNTTYRTQKYYFLIEKETGKHVRTIPMQGLTKY